MEPVAIILLAALALRYLAGRLSIDVVTAFGALFIGWRSADGWPRGVQEEDRDRPWGAPSNSMLAQPSSALLVDDRADRAPLMAVRWRVGRR